MSSKGKRRGSAFQGRDKSKPAKVELKMMEVYAWYSYDFANSCLSSVATSIFLPLILLYMAKDMACPHVPSAVMINGWALKDSYYLADGSFKRTGFGYNPVNLTAAECNAAGDWSHGGKCVNYFFRNLSTPCWADIDYCDANKARLDDSYEKWDYCRVWIQAMGQQAQDERENSTWIKNCSYESISKPVGVGFFFIGNFTFNNTRWNRTPNAVQRSYEDTLKLPEMSPTVVNHPFQACNFSHHLTYAQYTDANYMNNSYDQIRALCKADSGLSANTKIWAEEMWPDFGDLEPWEMSNHPDRPGFKFGSIINKKINVTFDRTTGLGNLTMTNNAWRRGGQSIRVYITDGTTMNRTTALNHQTFSVYVNATENCWGFINMLGSLVYPASFSGFIIGYAVIFQALGFILFASFGDFGNMRKKILLTTAYIGGIVVALIPIICHWSSSLVSLVVITIVKEFCFGLSIVMYNAYLPFLAKDHKAVKDMIRAKKKAQEICDKYKDIQQQISDLGYTWGYVAGVLGMGVGAGLFLFWPSKGYHGWFATPFAVTSIKWIVSMTGVWWVVFTAPTHTIAERPGAKIPGDGGVIQLIYISAVRVYESIGSLGMLPQSMKFFICFFFYSDGYSTISNVGVFFATEELGMNMTGLVVLAALSPFAAGIGILTCRRFHNWAKRNNKFGKNSEDIIIICLFYYIVLLCYVLIGFLNLGFGVVTAIELYIFVGLYGWGLGNMQTFSRTTYTVLIPPGQEAEFFGLYEVSDKGSSWLGPSILAILYTATGNMRYTCFYLVFTMAWPLALILTIDFDAAKKDCSSLKMAMHLKSLKNKRTRKVRKGVMSFLSLNSIKSSVKSVFNTEGASSYAKSTISELRSSAKSTMSSIQSSAKSSVVSSVSPSSVASSVMEEDDDDIEDVGQSEFDDDLERELAEIKKEQDAINEQYETYEESVSIVGEDDDAVEDIDED